MLGNASHFSRGACLWIIMPEKEVGVKVFFINQLYNFQCQFPNFLPECSKFCFNLIVLMFSVLHFFIQVPFPIPLEVNIVLVGFNGDGGYRYSLDSRKLASVLKDIFPNHRPTCLGTALQLDIEHTLYYNVLSVSNLEHFKVNYKAKYGSL